jgi:hypothetical protein
MTIIIGYKSNDHTIDDPPVLRSLLFLRHGTRSGFDSMVYITLVYIYL